MYKVFYNDELLYLPQGANDEHKRGLRDAVLNLAVGSAGSFAFTIDPEHPAYDALRPLAGIVKVVDQDAASGASETVFLGRITRQTTQLDRSLVVECEGVLACLNDTLMTPYQFPQNVADLAPYQEAAASGNVVEYWLGRLLYLHNSMCWLDSHKIHLGNVTVSDSNNYIVRAKERTCTIWETILEDFPRSTLGGYLVARYDGDDVYLDYLAEFTEISGQQIAFGENLTDLSGGPEGGDFFNAVLPEGSDGLTIVSAANGEYEGYYKSGLYLIDTSKRGEYGQICRNIVWNEVTTVSGLLSKAKAALDAQAGELPSVIKASAVDMSVIDPTKPRLKIAQLVKVSSRLHGFLARYPLMELSIPILDPLSGEVTLGGETASLTGTVSRNNEGT